MSETKETVTMITIQYNGKEVKRQEIVPGVVKAGEAYLVKCSETGEYSYCNQARMDKQIAKFGSMEAVGEKYVGREGKRALKKAATPAAAVAEPAAEAAE